MPALATRSRTPNVRSPSPTRSPPPALRRVASSHSTGAAATIVKSELLAIGASSPTPADAAAAAPAMLSQLRTRVATSLLSPRGGAGSAIMQSPHSEVKQAMRNPPTSAWSSRASPVRPAGGAGAGAGAAEHGRTGGGLTISVSTPRTRSATGKASASPVRSSAVAAAVISPSPARGLAPGQRFAFDAASTISLGSQPSVLSDFDTTTPNDYFLKGSKLSGRAQVSTSAGAGATPVAMPESPAAQQAASAVFAHHRSRRGSSSRSRRAARGLTGSRVHRTAGGRGVVRAVPRQRRRRTAGLAGLPTSGRKTKPRKQVGRLETLSVLQTNQ